MENTKQVNMDLIYIGRSKLNSWDCNEWSVELEYEGRTIETKFYTGLAILEPTVDDVLHSLLMDGRASDYSSFEEWASDFGYDEDSRSAEATYHDCLENGRKIQKLLGDDVAYFEEKYEDY
jgi:hypothetical protein